VPGGNSACKDRVDAPPIAMAWTAVFRFARPRLKLRNALMGRNILSPSPGKELQDAHEKAR
jgi:hypothetical protein